MYACVRACVCFNVCMHVCVDDVKEIWSIIIHTLKRPASIIAFLTVQLVICFINNDIILICLRSIIRLLYGILFLLGGLFYLHCSYLPIWVNVAIWPSL
jgi:hypothetical protein